MVSSGLLRRVALIRTDVWEEPGASFIRVRKIGALVTTQAATSNRRTLRRNTNGISSSYFFSADHATPLYPQNLELISPISGGRSVGKVRLRTKGHGVCFVFPSR
jgi:hypothetical protein